MQDLSNRDSDFELKSGDMVRFEPRNPLMAKRGVIESSLRPQMVFFYKRIDTEEILTLTEQEASLMLQSSHRILLRQIGCSNGTTYQKYLDNCGLKRGDLIPKERAEQICKEAWNAEFEAAKGHYMNPEPNNKHFDGGIPVHKRANLIDF